jgi:NitT/TauT family transport system substrate-binding protein
VNARSHLPLVFLLILLFSAVGQGQTTPPAEPEFSRERPRKISFQTDWFPQAEQGGFYQAVAKGFYAEVGLDVTVVPGGPGAGATQRVAKGEAEIAMGRSDTVILAAANQALPLLIIGAITQHDYEALLVHDDSPVHTFADLQNRAVIASPGQPWILFLQKKVGLTFRVTPAKGNLKAFLEDPTAVQQCIYTNEPFTARNSGAKVRILPIAATGYDVYTVLFCRREFAEHNPNATRAFVAASLRGWRNFIEENPEPAFAEILRTNPAISRDLLVFSRGEMMRHHITTGDNPKGETLGQLSRDRLRNEINTLAELGISKKTPTVDEIASWDYLPKTAK